MTVAELERRISHAEIIEWQAFYDQEAHIQDAAQRHPKWDITQIWNYVKTAFGMHLQVKHGDKRNSGS